MSPVKRKGYYGILEGFRFATRMSELENRHFTGLLTLGRCRVEEDSAGEGRVPEDARGSGWIEPRSRHAHRVRYPQSNSNCVSCARRVARRRAFEHSAARRVGGNHRCAPKCWIGSRRIIWQRPYATCQVSYNIARPCRERRTATEAETNRIDVMTRFRHDYFQ